MNVETLAPLMIVKLLYRPLVRSWNTSSSPLLFSFSSTSKPIMIKDQDQWSRIKDKDPESHVSHLCLLWLLPLYSIFHLTYLQHTLPTAFSAGKSRVFRENIQPWKSSKSWGVTKVRHYDCKVTFIDGNTPSNLFRGISYRLERLNRSTTYELVASVMNRWNISHFSIYQQFSIIILGISVTVGLTKETYSLLPRWIKVKKCPLLK